MQSPHEEQAERIPKRRVHLKTVPGDIAASRILSRSQTDLCQNVYIQVHFIFHSFRPLTRKSDHYELHADGKI